MQTTPIAALPYPELTDLPNGPAAFSGLASALDSIVIPRYTNAAARNVAITSPVAGQVVYLTTEGRYEYYNGSTWITRPRVERGSTNVSFTSLNAHTYNVNFVTPFTSPPYVSVNIASGHGDASMWASRAITITTTGFQVLLFRANGVSNSWSALPVLWMATGV